MTAHDRWPEIRRLFHDALDHDAGERESFVRDATADEHVRAEVLSLLAWDGGGADVTFNRPTDPGDRHEAPPGDSLLDATIGPWRIVGRIGQGGMGVVYRAVRADAAFEREVALKVVGHAPTPASLERFRFERETLARLDHPAIARLLDGGTTPDGHPYYVMELVDGVAVDRHCDNARLRIRRRLTVFLRICSGVQYAHQNLIVHRDVKPDNILVLADGSPKLLDFGVAKLVSEPGERPADAPRPSTWALTPDYASPEQMMRQPITTASDVYSLGVLLHVLLTGLLPRRHPPLVNGPDDASPSHVGTLYLPSRRTHEGDDAAARARCRSATPSSLARLLRGDLDAILARALAIDPADRYPTVEQLARDIERHRRDEPVRARPRRPLYVANRFWRRHAIGVATSIAFAMLAVIAVLTFLRQSAMTAHARAGADRRFEDVRSLTHAFMFDVHDAILNVPGTTQARALIVQTGVKYLERLDREGGGDPALRRALAAGLVKVGDAQGHPTSPNIGDTAGATESYGRAITIASALVAANADDAEAAATLALAHRRMADVLAWAGREQDALGHAEQSTRGFVVLATRPAATLEDRLQGAVAAIKMGDLLGNPNFPNLGRSADALSHYEDARASLAPLAAAQADDLRIQRYVGIVYERLGTMHEAAGRWGEAGAAYSESFRIRQALAVREPVHVDVQRDLAVAYEKLATVARHTGRHATAVQHYRAALSRFARLAALDASSAIAMRSVAISESHLADALIDVGAKGEAATYLRSALARHQALARQDPENAQAPCDGVRVAGDLALILPGGATAPAACDLWRESARLLRTPAAEGCKTAPDLRPRVRKHLDACRAPHVD